MAKKFDLDTYKSGTTQTQHTHNKYTRYLENELLSAQASEGHEGTVPEEENGSGAVVPAESKRINMAFTNENYQAILDETERLAVTCVYFINTLVSVVEEGDIEAYINALPIPRSKNNVMRRKGSPAKRINLRFSPEVYEKISAGAQRYGQTITQYVNTVVEVYVQDKHN